MRFAIGCAALLMAGISTHAQEAPAGFKSLFNGKDLTGWVQRGARKTGKDFWTAKDGMLVCTAGSGWLGTTEMYGDFILKLEWRVHKNGNSGLFFRVPDVVSKDSPSYTGFEIQILDDDGPQYKGKLKPYQYSGGLYHFVGVSKKTFKGTGEWNTYELTCKGDRIELVFNGEKVVDVDITKNKGMQSRPRRGFVGLQNHGHGVEFRNLFIKSLDSK